MDEFCAHCGAAMTEDALFCKACGTRKSSLTAPTESSARAITHPHITSTETTLSKEQLPQASDIIKKKTKIAICVALLVTTIAGFFLFNESGVNTELPFRGIMRGSTVEEVEKQLGTPDDFEDNGGSNFNYYYFDVEFLEMKGYVNIHFELSKVYTLSFICNTGTMQGYNRAVEYYTKKYGEPNVTNSDYSDYYSESERSLWEFEDGSYMELAYHSAGVYEKPTVSIRISR